MADIGTQAGTPKRVMFTQEGSDGFAEAFVAAAFNDAGFGGHGFPQNGAPFALLHPAVWDGLDGDRPAWVIYGSGSSMAISPGWDDQGGRLFSPISVHLSGGSVECYLNGATGAWWIAEDGVLKAAGLRIRRFANDLADGIFSRYLAAYTDTASGGLYARGIRHYGAAYDAVTHRSATSELTLNIRFFSPIGNVGSMAGDPLSGKRLDGTLAPTLAPVFPFLSEYTVAPPIYMGELLDLMVATDGFDLPSPPIPGWKVLKANADGRLYYALPTVLP